MTINRQQLLDSGNLPTLPTAAVRLLELSKSPDTGIQDLCDAIKSDPAISVRVIRAANASYFGLRHEVTSIEKAAMMLGPEMLTTITLTFYLAQESISSGPMAQHFSSYWLRCVIQAAAAESILEFVEQEGRSAAFLAGLLCDIGQLAMLRVFPRQFAALMERAKESGQPIIEIEQEELGFDHVDLGVDLAKKWQLPQTVVDSIANHHLRASDFSIVHELKDSTTVKSAIVGSAVGDHLCGGGATNSWRVLCDSSNELFGISASQLVAYLTKVHQRVGGASSLFNVDASKMPQLATIMEEAAELLPPEAIEIETMSQGVITATPSLECSLSEAKVGDAHVRELRDELTGLYSRSFFEQRLNAEIKKSDRAGTPLGLMFCGVDDFKALIDRYGQPFGNHVLQLVAEALQSTLGDSDLLARYDGQEFVAVLTSDSLERMSQVAKKMPHAIDELRICAANGPTSVSISAGACFIPKPEGDLKELRNLIIHHADEAMYAAKQNGRNQIRITIYDASLDNSLHMDVDSTVAADTPHAYTPE